MKKSVSAWSFPGEWSLEQKLAIAAEAGFQGYELDFAEQGPISPASMASDLEKIKAMCIKAGLEPSGLASGAFWSINPLSDDEQVRQKATRLLQSQIECANALEIDVILVVPGTISVESPAGATPIRYDVAYDRATRLIETALPIAEKLGVTIGVENVWNKFLLSPLEMVKFVDSFGSNYVASYFDVANVLATGYPEHWIELLGSRIRRVHFKDYRRNIGGFDGFVDLLSGDVNWPAVMAALRQVGYDGWLTAEMIPPVPFYKYSPATLLHNTSRAMDDIVAL